jgi:hypothetical protein
MSHTGNTSTISLTQKAGTQNSVATISANREDTSTPASRLVFSTNDGTSTLQRLRINNAGDISFYEDTGTTAKFFWDASAESLGIGTDSPDFTLDVEADKDTWISRIYNTGSDASAQALLVRSDATAAHDATVMGVYADSSYKMVVRSTGRVGIGQTNPKGSLEIYNNSTTTDGDGTATMTMSGQDSIILYGHGNVDSKNYGSIAWTDGGNRRRAMITSVTENADQDYLGLAFYTQGADGAGDINESMRIAHSGNVGIGTLTPSSALDVRANLEGNGTAATSTAYFVNKTSGATSGSIYIGASSGLDWKIGKNVTGISNNVNFSIADSSGNRRFDIDSSGNVGIGTPTPDQLLDVSGHAQIGDGGGAVLLNFNATSNAQLKLSNAELIRLDNSGQVTLLGYGGSHAYTVPQDQSLGYTNNLNAGAFGILHRASYDSYVTGNTYYYKSAGQSGWKAKYGAYKSTVLGMVNGEFSFDCSNAAPGSNGAAVSGLANIVKINSDGITMAAGKGISFSANSNATAVTSEILDDYEEGTIPASAFKVGGSSITSLNVSGARYVKVGNKVTVFFKAQDNSVYVGSTGDLTIDLPFTVESAYHDISKVICYITAGTWNNDVTYPTNITAVALSNSVIGFKLSSNLNSNLEGTGTGTGYFWLFGSLSYTTTS